MVADIDKKKIRNVVRKNVVRKICHCSCHRAVKLLEHGMKMVEMVFEKRLRRIVIAD